MSGYTAEAWKTIASGGRWTVPEVQKACVAHNPKMVQNAIRSMVEAGMVVRYEGKQPRYGITGDCSIPRGMKINEILKLMGAA